jgi:hypothetical protein
MIKLDLSIEEVNIILASLGKHPFENVFALVNKIQLQAVPQLPKEEEKKEGV